MSRRPAGLLEVLMGKAAAWLEVQVALSAVKRRDYGPLNASLICGWMEKQEPNLRDMPPHELSRALKENGISLVPASAAHAAGLGSDRCRRGPAPGVAKQRPFVQPG